MYDIHKCTVVLCKFMYSRSSLIRIPALGQAFPKVLWRSREERSRVNPQGNKKTKNKDSKVTKARTESRL